MSHWKHILAAGFPLSVILTGVSTPALAQIERVPHRHEVSYHGAIAQSKPDDDGDRIVHYIQCHLEYSKAGETLKFREGGLYLYHRWHLKKPFSEEEKSFMLEGAYRLSKGKSTGDIETVVSTRFSNERDILQFISDIDKLYTEPLKGSKELHLKLEPSDPGDLVRFLGQPLKLGKAPKNYHVWSPGTVVQFVGGPSIFDKGWYPIDFAILRETLVRAASEAGLKPASCPDGLAISNNAVAGRIWNHRQDPPWNARAAWKKEEQKNQPVTVWSRQTGGVLAGHKGEVTDVEFSPDGKVLATSSRDNTVILWDVSSGRLRATLTGHKKDVTCIAFSPDGVSLATGSEDRTIKLWNTADGTLGATLQSLPHGVKDLAISPDGRYLANSLYKGGSYRLWDLSSGKLVKSDRYFFDAWVDAIRFTPDGESLVWAEGPSKSIHQLNIAADKDNITFLKTGIRNFAFSTDGKYFVSNAGMGKVRLVKRISKDEKLLKNAASRRFKHSFAKSEASVEQIFDTGDESVFCLSISPDSKYLVTSSGESPYSYPPITRLKLWDLGTSTLVGDIKAELVVTSVGFSPDGELLALAGYKNKGNLVRVISFSSISKSPPAADDVPKRASLSGNWDVKPGPLKLQVEANTLSGTYPFFGGKVKGRVSKDGKLAKGTWTQANGYSGSFVLELSADGKSVAGKRMLDGVKSASDAESWSGHRLP